MKPQNEMVTVKLDTPLQRGDTRIEEVNLRKPKSGELRGLNLSEIITMDVNSLQKLLPRITLPSLTEHEISELDPADLMELATETASFFMRKAIKDSLPA
ncbi:MAG: phage tail assembly protein [Marinobacterium sp.]|nr:phage tail assembly protein [Marinobacterium sp.]